jgi:hypothetical protein
VLVRIIRIGSTKTATPDTTYTPEQHILDLTGR